MMWFGLLAIGGAQAFSLWHFLHHDTNVVVAGLKTAGLVFSAVILLAKGLS